MSLRRSRRRTSAFLAANRANAQKSTVRVSLRATTGCRRPKPPKPTWLNRSRMSRISQISQPPNPLRSNSLLSIGCGEKRPVFRNKIVAHTILRCCSRSERPPQGPPLCRLGGTDDLRDLHARLRRCTLGLWNAPVWHFVRSSVCQLRLLWLSGPITLGWQQPVGQSG